MPNRDAMNLFFGIDPEGDEAVVGVVGQRVNDHSEYHNDVLTSLLHREEGDDVVGQVLPAETLEQDPADTQLQCQTDEETTDEEEELASEVILGLEYPIPVPQETVDDTEDVARDVGDTVRKAQFGVEQIERDQGDERVQHANHTVFQQLYARLAGLGLVYLHDNSFYRGKIRKF